MQIKPEQLANHLQRQVAPLYFVYGDEPLLVQEACDLIRQQARNSGCSEREVYSVEAGFDWHGFLQAGDALSLFAERKLLELRMPTGKPGGDAGAKALCAYAERPSPDNVLLIQAGKLEAAARRSKWYKALDGAGVMVPVWPVERRQLPGWAMRRMRARGLQPTQQAVALLVERVEGNLLACAQEIEKLLLLHGPGAIDEGAVAASVADSARFDIYKLVDEALQGDGARTARIVDGLQSEGVEPVLVLWALTREIRAMAKMAFQLQQGTSPDQVIAKNGVWEKRKPLVRAGLKRHSVTQWRAMLHQAGELDAVIKGGRNGNIWDGVLALSLQLGGTQLVGKIERRLA